ncbi:MAG: vWA domain-containing protein, partial [Archaeoglobaceae archaeon]
YLRAKIYMPMSIGGIAYRINFSEYGGHPSIYIESDEYQLRKTLSLGAFASLKFDNLSGIAYSLNKEGKIELTRSVIEYPSAVLKIKPNSVLSGNNVTIDVSNSTSPVFWEWKVLNWNGTVVAEGDKNQKIREITIYWSSDIPTRCKNYTLIGSSESAVCNFTLIVTDSRGFYAEDTEEVLIANRAGVEPDLYIRKFIVPDTLSIGQPFELHLKLVGRGFVLNETRKSLSVVTVIDRSLSMHAGNINEAHSERTLYKSFTSSVQPNITKIVFDVNSSFKNDEFYVNISSNPVPERGDSAFAVYITKPDGSNLTLTGVRTYKDDKIGDSEIGNWTFEIIVANKYPLNLNIRIYSGQNCPDGSSCKLRDIITATYTPNITLYNFSLPSGYTRNNVYEFAYVYVPEKYRNSFYLWLGNNFCNYYSEVNGSVCFLQNINSEQNYTVYIVPRLKNATSIEGSLWIEKLDAAKIASIKFLNDSLNLSDYKGLVNFSTSAYAHIVNNSSYLTKLTTDTSVVISQIKNITASGYTNYLLALNKSLEILTENESIISGTKPLIVFLSDGMPTCKRVSSCSGVGCYNLDGEYFICSLTACNPDDCGSQVIPRANEIKNITIGGEYIDICTIGFGDKKYYNETILKLMSGRRNLTNQSQIMECYYSAQTLDELINAFVSIGKLYERAATNITLNDTIPIEISLYMYPEVKPELFIDGKANCTLEWDFVSGGTSISMQCSEIYIDDIVEIVLKLMPKEAKTIKINEGGIVVYYDINNQRREFRLPEMWVEVKSVSGASVEIS